MTVIIEEASDKLNWLFFLPARDAFVNRRRLVFDQRRFKLKWFIFYQPDTPLVENQTAAMQLPTAAKGMKL
ncbi:MAG: hypothetical protein ABI685_11110 [Ferruginibacter sp.]